MISQFLNLSEAEYHADRVGLDVPTLSSHCAFTILKHSPLMGWMTHPKGGAIDREERPILDEGSLLHALILGEGKRVVVVAAPDWRTVKAREQRDEAYKNGMIPINQTQHDKIITIARSVSMALAEQGVNVSGMPEVSGVFDDEGVACRFRMDLWQPQEFPIPVITELKFTNRVPTTKELERMVFDMGYDIQAHVYMRAVKRIQPEVDQIDFRWIFAEKTAPYSVVVARPDDLYLDLGKRRWEMARDLWRQSLETGRWPGPPSDLLLLPPIWALREYDVSVFPAAVPLSDVIQQEENNGVEDIF